MRQMTTRERLFHEAIRLFATRGYRATTVGDIEAAAGLTARAGGFYRHFPSKEAIILEALEAMAAEMVAELRLADLLSLASPRAELLVIARGMLRHSEQYRPLRLILAREAQTSPRVRKAARQANERLASLDVVPWVRAALKRAGASSSHATEIALLIFGPVIARIFALDRDDRALEVDTDAFLLRWAEHWTSWFASGAAY